MQDQTEPNPNLLIKTKVNANKTWAKEKIGDEFRDELSEAQETRKKRGISATYDHSYQVNARIPMMAAWDEFVSSKL